MANSADPDQKPTDLDLHCLQRQGIFRFSRTKVKKQEIFPGRVANMINQEYKSTTLFMKFASL